MPETLTAPGPANFIAGDWSPSAGNWTYERVNPWRPTEVVGQFPSPGYGPHEQGRAAIEFYTEEVTVYRDV